MRNFLFMKGRVFIDEDHEMLRYLVKIMIYRLMSVEIQHF
jgi:hypothetical protein